MGEIEYFYAICPTKKCMTISGFYLSEKEIKKNEKYICSECGKESNLKKWEKSTYRAMLKQIKNRKKQKKKT